LPAAGAREGIVELKRGGEEASMSSLRNAVRRRAHKERSQPQNRARFGLLEKHKDYVLRAKDFHRKEDSIRRLREKAAFRNPDEFYYKMINSKTVDGIHRPKIGGKEYTEEELQLMKTQDFGYLMSKWQAEKKKVERLQSSFIPLHVGQSSSKHIHFAEDREQAKELRPAVVKDMPEDPLRAPRVSKGVKRELKERSERAEKLRELAMTMSLQKQLTTKGRKRKLRPDEISTPTDKPVYKWRQERKT
jgi:U3 small nucleolar RNA-associated protein 11